MRKEDIVRAIVANVYNRDGKKFKLQEVQDVVNYAIELTKQSLYHGDKVVFRGFGTFSIRHRGARKVLNNKTKEWTVSKDKDYAHFLMSKDFDRLLNM